MIQAYLDELSRSLHVRGRERERFLREVGDHLLDLAASAGESEAIAAFGAPAELAAAFDLECAFSRGVRASSAAAVAIVTTGASTLALVHGADSQAPAPAAWAIVFFLAAQIAIACVALVLLQSLRMRRFLRGGGDIALLWRRAAVGTAAAAITMFTAGAGLAGKGSALLLLAGPAITVAASPVLFRAWRMNRRLPGAHDQVDSPPLADVRALLSIPLPTFGPGAVAAIAAACAFGRDLGERGSTMRGSLGIGVLEALMVLLSYLCLRRPLGLRSS